MTWKRSFLVVANVTATSDELIEALKARAPASFTLIIPAPPNAIANPSKGYASSTQRAAASWLFRRRFAEALASSLDTLDRLRHSHSPPESTGQNTPSTNTK